MKKLILLSFSLCLILSAFAQPWINNLKKENPTFFEIQKSFNDYWKDKPIEKGKGYKPFKRWEWYWEQRVSENGVFPKNSVNIDEWKKYIESSTYAKSVNSCQVSQGCL